ncbi:hypothetical protein SAMN04488074_102558 [Lentzea albidocapillata subsp. violacea]|uniref:Uncharacterized protein n=1 Tax=Lentzea albidocapillata subsp. violacea TaxID=128104 RepID=A0A1G8V9I7_9PSEU|nr:hypothetical protein SAMN04488074_102558 [Lentzea albidocapillata subsp. violacea]
MLHHGVFVVCTDLCLVLWSSDTQGTTAPTSNSVMTTMSW